MTLGYLFLFPGILFPFAMAGGHQREKEFIMMPVDILPFGILLSEFGLLGLLHSGATSKTKEESLLQNNKNFFKVRFRHGY